MRAEVDAPRRHVRLTRAGEEADVAIVQTDHAEYRELTAADLPGVTRIVDGRRVNACLTLAVMQEGAKVTTIEGLGTPDALHPMQAAFVKHDGYQCGYCTPGQICSAVAVLDEIRDGIPSHVTTDLTAAPALSGDEIRERMSGNLCRCGAYAGITEGVIEAQKILAEQGLAELERKQVV